MNRVDSSNFFHELGARTQQEWRGRNFDDEALPEAALAALRALPPSEHITCEDLWRGFLAAEELPEQNASTFGEPPLIVYQGRRFHIEVLHWLTTTTEIHGHSFFGAFHVLAGSSLHAWYAFEETRRVSSTFSIGQVRLDGVEHLTRGATRPIRGADLPHALFHLDQPSITVVIRTEHSLAKQYQFLPPHVAFDSRSVDATQRRKAELVAMMGRLDPVRWAPEIATFVAEQDPQTAFLALRAVYPQLKEHDRVELVLERARARHTELIEPWTAALEQDLWRQNIQSRREDVPDPGHRFLLALLLNLPERAPILEMIRARFGADPVERIMGWLDELLRTDPDHGFEVLGIEVTPQDTPHGARFGARLVDAFRLVFRAMLLGHAPEVIAAQLAGAFPAEITRAEAGELLDAWAPLRESLFRPLFT